MSSPQYEPWSNPHSYEPEPKEPSMWNVKAIVMVAGTIIVLVLVGMAVLY